MRGGSVAPAPTLSPARGWRPHVTPRGRRYLPEIVVAALVGAAGSISLPLFFRYGNVTWAFAVVWGLATLGSVLIVPAVRRAGVAWPNELRTLFVASAIVGVVSVLTGIGNNATDEPYTMGPYLSELLHGRDPYTSIVLVSYSVHTLNLWSNHVSAPYHYVYLPLLLFFQVPGTGATGYKFLGLACWAGIVYLVRKDEVGALCLVSPVVALLAANGFTDLPVLLLLTLSLRGGLGPNAWPVEVVTYGMKQFANAFWLVYHLVRRELLRAALVLVGTLAIALPFLLWHPDGIWCEALTFSAAPGCSSAPSAARSWSDLYAHWNYYLWPLWIYALFSAAIHRGWRRLKSRVRPAAPATADG